MSEQKPSAPSELTDIYKARERLEKLTREYIEKLLKSQSKAEDHARFLAAILNSVGDGLLVFDNRLNLVLANQAAAEIARQEIELKSRDQLFEQYTFYKADGKTEYLKEEEPIRVAFKESRPVEAEGVIKGGNLPPDGIFVRVNAAPVIGEDDNLLGGVTVFHDISERVRILRQRDTLAAILAHDLKNHLAAEDTIIQILIERYSNQMKDDDLELLHVLKKSNLLYMDLSQTLLEVYRTDLCQDTAKLVDIDVSAALNAAIAMNELTASRKGIKLECHVEEDVPLVKGIVSAWRQALHNLIQNAVSASSEGQCVGVAASIDGNNVSISVSDKGRGMSAEEVSSIFDPARPLEKLPKSTVSSGFGLYLCRFLIEAQGGQIICISDPDEGTTFLVEYPISPDEE